MDNIEALETIIGTDIPDSLVNFFLNLPVPDMKRNRILREIDQDFHQENIITKFWTPDEVIRVWNNMKTDDIFSYEKVLPFAETLGSAVICIGIDKLNKGEIFVFDYDFFSTKLAASMEEFLNKLY